jgi:L-amino acid N-acyltransferase YncA
MSCRRLVGIDLGIATAHTVRVLDGEGTIVAKRKAWNASDHGDWRESGAVAHPWPTAESLAAVETVALAGCPDGTRLEVVIEPMARRGCRSRCSSPPGGTGCFGCPRRRPPTCAGSCPGTPSPTASTPTPWPGCRSWIRAAWPRWWCPGAFASGQSPLGVRCVQMGGDAGAVTSSMRECSHLLRSLLLPTGVLTTVSAMDHMADPQRPMASTFTIREAREDDWPQIWPIIHDVITEQQTFAYDPAMSEDDAKGGWLLTAPARVVVAAGDNLILGTSNMYANRPGPGSHVASGSLMVAKQARGKGVGRALTTDMISWARRSRFAAIQFNAVVDTNTAAVLLYESLGFVTLGTAPGAFRHPLLGPVGLRIMWLDLRHPTNATN